MNIKQTGVEHAHSTGPKDETNESWLFDQILLCLKHMYTFSQDTYL